MGGGLPRGYRVEDRKLIVVPEQAEEVRKIYREFLDCSGLRELGLRLEELGIIATTRSGGHSKPISRGAQHQLLRNPIYVGLIPHKGERFPGQHEPIVDQALWDAVQIKLKAGSSERNGIGRKTEASQAPQAPASTQHFRTWCPRSATTPRRRREEAVRVCRRSCRTRPRIFPEHPAAQSRSARS